MDSYLPEDYYDLNSTPNEAKYQFISFGYIIMGSEEIDSVTGPPGALLFDVKPEIALKESLELLF